MESYFFFLVWLSLSKIVLWFIYVAAYTNIPFFLTQCMDMASLFIHSPIGGHVDYL